MKKRCNRRPVAVRPPAGLRKKLSADKLRDLSVAHHQVLDDIATGRGDKGTLWQLVEAAYLWSYVAEIEKAGVPEMKAHLELVRQVVQRFERTGRVGFSGPEYQQCKDAVVYMDQLAALTDESTSMAAALASRDLCDAMYAEQEEAARAAA